MTKRGKPVGKSNYLSIQFNGPLPPDTTEKYWHFPTDKRQLEQFIVDHVFYAIGKKIELLRNVDPSANANLANPIQLEENDFDFRVEYQGRKAYLELMEIAPLSSYKTKYQDSPNYYDTVEFAELLFDNLEKKSLAYGKKPEDSLFLLLYNTDFKFELHDRAKLVLSYFCHVKRHLFDMIMIYTPRTHPEGEIEELYPINFDFTNFNPEDHRGKVTFLDAAFAISGIDPVTGYPCIQIPVGKLKD